MQQGMQIFQLQNLSAIVFSTMTIVTSWLKFTASISAAQNHRKCDSSWKWKCVQETSVGKNHGPFSKKMFLEQNLVAFNFDTFICKDQGIRIIQMIYKMKFEAKKETLDWTSYAKFLDYSFIIG